MTRSCWMQLWTPSWCADPPPWTTRSICAWTEATTTQRARPQCATTNEIWSRVVYGGQAASSVCMMSLAFLTPSLKVTPPTTSVSSSDLFSRLHPLCADSASL